MVERKLGFARFGARTSVYRVQAEPSYIVDLLPPHAYGGQAVTSFAAKFVHTSINKLRVPILVVKWTPEGRRIVTGSRSGEFTLWNGMTFNFESIMQAHDNAICAITHSHSDDWLLSGDREGVVKFWQPNFNNLNILQAHTEVVRDIAFSPNDTKFVTASDDSSLKIWNFNDSTQERTLTGHNWDVKCADWHPSLGLIASGSKDNLVKLWDPRIAGPKSVVATYHGFKNTVTRTRFQKTGGQALLASGSRDQTVRVLDLRTMKDVVVLRGHNSDVCSLTWHPLHANLITTGTQLGSICHFLIDTPLPENTAGLMPAGEIVRAHEMAVWSLDYHPLGHLLVSGANDKTTRIWARGRPGDNLGYADWYHTAPEAAAAAGILPPGGGNYPMMQQHGGYGATGPPGANKNQFAPGDDGRSGTASSTIKDGMEIDNADLYGGSNAPPKKKQGGPAIPGLGFT